MEVKVLRTSSPQPEYAAGIWTAGQMGGDTGTWTEGVVVSRGEQPRLCEMRKCTLQLLSSSENTATIGARIFVLGILFSGDDES